MFDLENIKVSEFFLLDEAMAYGYIELQTIMKSKDVFLKRRAKTIKDLTFGEVSQLKRILSKPSYDNLYQAFNIMFGVKQHQYLNAHIVDFFYALNHIREFTTSIMRKELKALASDVDTDLEMAGIKRLSVFGDMAILIGLGQKFNKAPTEIEHWKYNLVFTIMLYDKIHGEIQKNYLEIQKANAKRKT